MTDAIYTIGKRETAFAMLSELQPHPSYPVLHDDIIPEPFNLDEELNAIQKHHHRQRRNPTCCNDRYLLFMLDTSGSIGNAVNIPAFNERGR